MPPIPGSWLSEKSWGEILRLSDLPGFKGFLDHFKAKIEMYKQLYDSPAPHDFKLEDSNTKRLTSFQKMIILRCIRPDKVIPAIFNYIVE